MVSDSRSTAVKRFYKDITVFGAMARGLRQKTMKKKISPKWRWPVNWRGPTKPLTRNPTEFWSKSHETSCACAQIVEGLLTKVSERYHHFWRRGTGSKAEKKKFPPTANCPYIGIFPEFWKIFSVIWKKIRLLIFFKNFFFPWEILNENFTTKNLRSFRYHLGAKINPKSWWDFSGTYGMSQVMYKYLLESARFFLLA